MSLGIKSELHYLRVITYAAYDMHTRKLFKIKVRNETRNQNRIRPQPKGRFRIDSLLILTFLKSKLFQLIRLSLVLL